MTADTLMRQINTAASIGREHPLTGLSIAARATLSAHDLNNEGSRNNTQYTRQVDVVSGDRIIQVNAVSGDVLKHGFVDNLRALALAANTSELLVCDGCRRSDPNRLNADFQFQQALKGIDKSDNASVINEVLRRCVIDDLAGLLVTQGNTPRRKEGQPDTGEQSESIGGRNAPRRSVMQFGWLLGIPEHVRTGNYVHVKLVPGATEDDTEGSNRGQNIFTRPASSGQYAFVTQFAISRIGYNDINAKAVLDGDTRRRRARAALEALYLTLAAPSGAQRNTQLPHLQGATGAVCVSFGPVPPVLYSPLEDGFSDQMEQIAGAFGRLGSDLALIRFDTIGELGEILQAATTWLGNNA